MHNRSFLLFVLALLAGCATNAGSPAAPSPAATAQAPSSAPSAKPEPMPVSQLLRRPGGFYNDDAPDGPLPVNLDTLADPTPRTEPLNARANEPYTVFGKEYVPYKALVEYWRQGTV